MPFQLTPNQGPKRIQRFSFLITTVQSRSSMLADTYMEMVALHPGMKRIKVRL
jgi:hypothetical protein